MIVIILILFVLTCFFVTYLDEGSIGISFFVGTFVGFITFSVYLIMDVTIADAYKVETRRDDINFPIHSLKLQENGSGSFILGTGKFGYNDKYKFYTRDEKYGYSLRTENCYDTYLVEIEDDSSPRGWFQIVHHRSPYWFSLWGTYKTYTKTTLYIPKGTIIEKYEAN